MPGKQTVGYGKGPKQRGAGADAYGGRPCGSRNHVEAPLVEKSKGGYGVKGGGDVGQGAKSSAQQPGKKEGY